MSNTEDKMLKEHLANDCQVGLDALRLLDECVEEIERLSGKETELTKKVKAFLID